MPVDASIIGMDLGEVSLHVDAGRLRFFAKATGQRDPVYTDPEAARAAGHRDLPVPPTFFAAVPLERPDGFAWLGEIGVDLRSILHGSQSFDYHAMAYAGDMLTVRTSVVDVFEKKGGALQFIVREGIVTNQDGVHVATMRGTTVVQTTMTLT